MVTQSQQVLINYIVSCCVTDLIYICFNTLECLRIRKRDFSACHDFKPEIVQLHWYARKHFIVRKQIIPQDLHDGFDQKDVCFVRFVLNGSNSFESVSLYFSLKGL